MDHPCEPCLNPYKSALSVNFLHNTPPYVHVLRSSSALVGARPRSHFQAKPLRCAITTPSSASPLRVCGGSTPRLAFHRSLPPASPGGSFAPAPKFGGRGKRIRFAPADTRTGVTRPARLTAPPPPRPANLGGALGCPLRGTSFDCYTCRLPAFLTFCYCFGSFSDFFLPNF